MSFKNKTDGKPDCCPKCKGHGLARYTIQYVDWDNTRRTYAGWYCITCVPVRDLRLKHPKDIFIKYKLIENRDHMSLQDRSLKSMSLRHAGLPTGDADRVVSLKFNRDQCATMLQTAALFLVAAAKLRGAKPKDWTDEDWVEMIRRAGVLKEQMVQRVQQHDRRWCKKKVDKK